MSDTCQSYVVGDAELFCERNLAKNTVRFRDSMSKDIQTLTIPEGYAFVRFGKPAIGEMYLAYGGVQKSLEKNGDFSEDFKAVVVQPRMIDVDMDICLRGAPSRLSATFLDNSSVILGAPGYRDTLIKAPNDDYVFTKELRSPKRGEFYLSITDPMLVCECRDDFSDHVRCLIMRPDPEPEETFTTRIEANPFALPAARLASLLNAKNKAYGSAYKTSVGALELLFPNGIPVDRYQTVLLITRIWDKLQRLATLDPSDTEDPWQDIAGYALLGMTTQENKNEDQ